MAINGTLITMKQRRIATVASGLAGTGVIAVVGLIALMFSGFAGASLTLGCAVVAAVLTAVIVTVQSTKIASVERNMSKPRHPAFANRA